MNFTLDPQAALVIVGHGSTQNDMSAQPAREQVERLRKLGLFGEVHAAFWKEEPLITGILERIRLRTIYIVPFFVSEGYFSETAIPRALGFPPFRTPQNRVRVVDGRTLVYTRPVGVHASVTEALLQRAREVVEAHPFPAKPAPAEISLFIAGHGTSQSPNNRLTIEGHARRIQELGLYAGVRAVFLEEAPRIGECYDLAQTQYIVLAPCFLSDGLHVAEDIPVLLGEPEAKARRRLAAGLPAWKNPTGRRGRLVWCARAIGGGARLAEVILGLVEEGRGWVGKRNGG